MDLLPLIEEERAKVNRALLTADEVAMVAYNVAARTNGRFGVLLKPHGTGGYCPIGRISLDILVDIPEQQEYDIFASADGENGSPGPAIPVFHQLPFKVGQGTSGASMDRVRAVILPSGDEEADVDDAKPQPKPEKKPEPSQPAVCECGVGSVVEMLALMNQDIVDLELKVEEKLEAAIILLRRLEDANRKPRDVSVSGRWTGTLRGEVSGIEG
jgi:hypothetical protein